MTHQFFCHYTGKDGHTTRRRLQQLTFFDHVPSIGNSTSSPTPLWEEIIYGRSSNMLIIHAQLSDTVAVYTEIYLSTTVCLAIQQNDLPKVERDAADEILTFLHQITDYTSYLIAHPLSITPPVLNAYKEARPEEYQKLKALSLLY